MSEYRIEVIESQLDAMSEKVEELSAKMQALLKILSDKDVATRTGIDSGKQLDLSTAHGPMTQNIRHKLDRETRVRTKERESAIDALLRDARISGRTDAS